MMHDVSRNEQQYLLLMRQQESLSEYNDQKMLTTQGEEPDFRLPRVENHATRPQVRSKAEKRKNSPTLPHLKKSAHSNYDIISEVPSKRTLGGQRDQFALQIQEKLKLVLQKVKQGENLDERSEEEEAEVDFEEAIQHNKERIKQHKLQNQARALRVSKPNSREARNGSQRPKPPKSNNKPENLYEKRMREASLDNKFLLKKKEIIERKNEALEKVKHLVKERQEELGNKHVSSIPLPVRIVGRHHNSPKKSPPKPKQQPIPSPNSNNLFDNIHNLLQNPLKNRIHSSSASPQDLKSLQLKILKLNQKLGVSDTIDTKREEEIPIANQTALDWKRFVYTDSSNFKCYQDSNFQREMEKVGRLQQKNENYLNQYLDHQKMLVELAFLKKLEGRPTPKP